MLRFFKHPIAKGFLTPLIAGVVLGILAPFGSSNFDLFFRFAFWIGLTLAGGVGAMAAAKLQTRFAPDLSTVWRTVIQSIGATAAVSPFVFSLNPPSSATGFILTLFYIWVVAIVITAFGILAEQRHKPPIPGDKRAPLLERLPPKFRDAPLYAISSEDHYIRIHSEVGEHMILMRLGDAEDLAAPLPGLKPHRSWWVAEAGVEKIIKTDGKLRIRLKSGTEVPVSREGAKRVRAANWV